LKREREMRKMKRERERIEPSPPMTACGMAIILVWCLVLLHAVGCGLLKMMMIINMREQGQWGKVVAQRVA
jgi:hypothetical protein